MLELFKIGGAKSWIAPELIQVNRLPSRATAYPFPSEQLAQAAVREDSPWYLSLNGEWDFQLFEMPEQAPADFVQPTFAPSAMPTGGRLPSRATGRCKTPSTSRTTPTCRCRSPRNRRRCRRKIPPAATALRSTCRRTGPAGASCCISAARKACSTFTSTATPSA